MLQFTTFFKKTKDMFCHWINSDYNADLHRTREDKVDWERCVPFVLLHLGALAALFVGVSPVAIIAALASYFIRMFAITAFYHRYFSHRSFKTNRAMQCLIAIWGNTAMQRGPLWWAANHRHHHQHSDTEEDIHSPGIRGFWWSHIGWITSQKNFPTDYKKVKDLSKFPELVFINKYDQLVPWIYGIFMYLLGYVLETCFPLLGTTALQFFIWTFFVSTVFLLHGTLFINSLAHIWGKKCYATVDDSRNSFLLAFITLGEGWHNNHHRYPHSTRQGFLWWEIDPTYYGLKIMNYLGLIRDFKPVPKKVIQERHHEPS